jgi:hypothetical protein
VCDAILIPTDASFSINTHWCDYLDADHKAEPTNTYKGGNESWVSQQLKHLKCVDKKPWVWLGNVGQVGAQSDFEPFKQVVAEFRISTRAGLLNGVRPDCTTVSLAADRPRPSHRLTQQAFVDIALGGGGKAGVFFRE